MNGRWKENLSTGLFQFVHSLDFRRMVGSSSSLIRNLYLILILLFSLGSTQLVDFYFWTFFGWIMFYFVNHVHIPPIWFGIFKNILERTSQRLSFGSQLFLLVQGKFFVLGACVILSSWNRIERSSVHWRLVRLKVVILVEVCHDGVLLRFLLRQKLRYWKLNKFYCLILFEKKCSLSELNFLTSWNNFLIRG